MNILYNQCVILPGETYFITHFNPLEYFMYQLDIYSKFNEVTPEIYCQLYLVFKVDFAIKHKINSAFMSEHYFH